VIQQKNQELENRLENISRLIHKNEQLSNQLRVQKQRTERFKADAIGNYQKEISEKASEIEVLKEMLRGHQVQIKAREKEIMKQKQRLEVI